MGDDEAIKASYQKMNGQPVDWDLSDRPAEPLRCRQTTLADSASISGPGTFMGKAVRTITFEPTHLEGWWFDRIDLPGSLPIRAGISNVWTTGQIVSNIVLRSGNPHNYVRMVEHLVSLRMGMGIDNLMILPGNKVMPPPMEALVAEADIEVHGFLLPGHVSVITGWRIFEFLAEDHGVSGTVVGFEPADVLRGVLDPADCGLFGTSCTPETPRGACMVSGEGSCAARYHYRSEQS